MASVTYTNGTIVGSTWLNDLDALRWGNNDSTRGAALLQVYQAGTGAQATTVQAELRLNVNIVQYMTDAQRADALLATPVLDHASAMTSAIAKIMGSQGAIATYGGSIYIPAACKIRLATNPFGILPNDGATPPTQCPIRIYGSSCDSSFTGNIAQKNASTIDFIYTTANNAKIDTRGRGVLELDHLTISDSSGNSEAFLFTSNTIVLIHDNLIIGSKTSGWNQDGIILGGTSTSFGTTSATAAFQGYGSQIYNNHFHKIRRAVYARVFANGVPIHHNTVSFDCGFATGAPFEYDGDPTATPPVASIGGVPNHHNLIEMVGYKYGVQCRSVNASTIGPNDFYDAAGGTTSYYTFGAGATFNQIIPGFHADTTTFVEETGTGIGTNSWLNPHQSQTSNWRQPFTIKNQFTVSSTSTDNSNLTGLNSDGGVYAHRYISTGTQSYRITHTPNGGSLTQLIRLEDFGGGTIILNLPGTDTRIRSDVSLINLDGPVFLGGTLAFSGGATIQKVYYASASLDFANTASGAASDLTITVTGASVSDTVILGIDNASIVAGAAGFYAWVSAANTVTVRFWNASGGNLNPATGTFKVSVIKF